MAGGFVTMPQVLQVIGQAPNQHGRKTAIENLRAVKSLFPMFGINGKLPPQMQQMVDQVMQNGPAAMIQNPMGAISGLLSGQAGMLGAQLGAIPGGEGIAAALSGSGGLQSAITRLAGTAQSLVGLPGGIGAFDLNSVVGHAGLLSLGEVPAALGLDRVLGPVFAGDAMGLVQGTLQRVADAADPSGMVGEVLARGATLNGIVDASIDAMTQGLQMTLGMSAFSVLADGLDPTRGDHALLGFFQEIVLPDALDAIAAHHEQMAAEAPLRSGRNPDGTIPGYTPPEGLEEP